jgi:hypothetical protein
MIPVVELLQGERDQSARFRGILVHIISNGSCLIPISLEVVFSYIPTRGRLAIHDAS